jgi:hypothetical protein
LKETQLLTSRNHAAKKLATRAVCLGSIERNEEIRWPPFLDHKTTNNRSLVTLSTGKVGMKPNGLRRFAILPQRGWEKATAACNGGPGGGGAGGDIKTDYVVVPTATMVQQEACFDTNKQPFPSTYAQQPDHGGPAGLYQQPIQVDKHTEPNQTNQPNKQRNTKRNT